MEKKKVRSIAVISYGPMNILGGEILESTSTLLPPLSFRARGLRNGAHDTRIPTHSTGVALLRFHKAKAYANLQNPHNCSGELESPFSTQQKTRATESGSHCMAN